MGSEMCIRDRALPRALPPRVSKSSSSLQAGWSRFRRSDKSAGGGSARGSAYFGGTDGAAADGGRRGSGANGRLAQYVWRVHRFGANELLWCVLTEDNHLALHTPAAEPTAAPPVFSLHLASVTTLSEALDRPGCLTISARARHSRRPSRSARRQRSSLSLIHI